MEKLINMNERFQALEPIKATEAAFGTSKVKGTTKSLNIDQLEEGKGGKGQQLRTDKAVYPNVYSYYTIMIKQMLGDPTDKVTLRDSGKFHQSLKVQALPGHAEVIGDTAKPDGDMNENIDVSEALGISPESRPELIKEVIPEMLVDMRKHLQI